MAEVVWDSRRRRHVVRDTMDPDEARNVAHALGLEDGAAEELLAAADLAEQMDADR